MHISEGVLSVPILTGGAVLTAGFVALGLKKTDYDKIPKEGMVASAFFVASLIHIPFGPASVHLVLNALVGILLGWSAFPAILIGLFLQALFFQYGGITSLGVNTLNMALPAIIVYYLFKMLNRKKSRYMMLFSGFICGMLAVLLSAFLMVMSLIGTGEEFKIC